MPTKRKSNLPKKIPGGLGMSIRSLSVVDHAGELGAVMIYRGQLDALALKKKFFLMPKIKEMLDTERIHLGYFESVLSEYNIRPTIVVFVWGILAYFFGFLSAFIGERFAMVLTESVEDVIVLHYENQIRYLNCINTDDFKSIKQTIKKFMADELDHKLNADSFIGSKQSFFESLAKKVIKKSCKAAISISQII